MFHRISPQGWLYLDALCPVFREWFDFVKQFVDLFHRLDSHLFAGCQCVADEQSRQDC